MQAKKLKSGDSVLFPYGIYHISGLVISNKKGVLKINGCKGLVSGTFYFYLKKGQTVEELKIKKL